jgi:alanyl-tRNA synthetase
VLGEDAMWTAATYVSGGHGRLTVRFNRKPTREEVEAIELLANQAVSRDLPIEVIVLPRSEAEERFGDIIYDLFPVPATATKLSIVVIRDVDGSIWNINACNKEHTRSTGCIERIKIGKIRFRKSKQLLEIPFDIED